MRSHSDSIGSATSNTQQPAKTTMLTKPNLFVDHHQHFRQPQQQQQKLGCQKRRLDSFMNEATTSSSADTSGLGPAEAALWSMLERRQRAREQRRQAAKQMRQQQLNHQSLPEFIATPTGKIWRKTADEFVYRDSRAALLHLIPTDDDEDGNLAKAAASKPSSTNTRQAKTLVVPKTAPMPVKPPMRFLVRPRFPS